MTVKKKSRDVIALTDDDYKGKKFKTAPGGEYEVKVSAKTAVAKGTQGNVAKVQIVITKGKHKSTIIFDNIAPHVGWKVAQLLKALGIKKTKLTLEEFVKLIKNKELRAIIKEEVYNKKKQNKIVQYLPLEADEDEEELNDDLDDEDDDEDNDADEEDEDDEDDEDEDEEDEEDDEEDDEDEDEDEDDDEEDEDDEPAVKRRAPIKKKVATKKVTKKTTRKK
jgi:DNA-directed RNA polymerase delta subunit